MRTIRAHSSKSALALALSIAVLPGLVNGQAPSLTSVNKSDASRRSELKADFPKLVDVLMKTGKDSAIKSNLAPVIGLEKTMPIRARDITINAGETRGCFIVYESIEGSAAATAARRPLCAYFMKGKDTGPDHESRYFKINLNGTLEKAVLSKGKIDKDGKAIRGTGVKSDQDISSPEVKKTFEAEMKFWLKDWLKKQQQAPAL